MVLSGLLRPDEVDEITGLDLPEEKSDTLGGLMTERLERFPRVGDEVVLEAKDENHLDADGLPGPVSVRLRVTRLDGWRVDRLLLIAEGPAEEAEK